MTKRLLAWVVGAVALTVGGGGQNIARADIFSMLMEIIDRECIPYLTIVKGQWVRGYEYPWNSGAGVK